MPDHQEGAEAARAPSLLHHRLCVAGFFVTAMSIIYAHINNVRAVRHEPPHVNELAPTEHCWQALPRGQFNDAVAVREREGMSEYEQRISSLACGLREERLEIVRMADLQTLQRYADRAGSGLRLP